MGGGRTPDVKFVEALEAALTVPIRHTHDALAKRYVTNHSFKRDLDQWMVSLGWTVVSDTEGLHSLLERAAKFGCYLFVNKLVFHEALLKKYGRTMVPLYAPPDITTGDDLQMRLQHFFAEAKQITGDYETIFGDDPKDTRATAACLASKGQGESAPCDGPIASRRIGRCSTDFKPADGVFHGAFL